MNSLTPLEFSSSRELIFEIIGEEIASTDEQYLDHLLEAVEGLPLAVTIIGHLLLDGAETPRSLWNCWLREKTRVLKNGGSDRLSKLDISLELSIHGPRMKDNPNAILVLAAISVLPGGLSASDQWLDDFQSRLP